MILQALRMTWRDWRAGELRFLLVALLVAVGALSSVGFFVDRVSNGLQRDANLLLGADLVVSSDAVLPPGLTTGIAQLQQTHTATLVSMALNADESLSRLVSVKSVAAGYPLRGQLTLDSGKINQQIPAPGCAWVDQAVLAALHLQSGEQLKLGDAFFTITHVIKDEPDRGSAFANIAPRVMINASDLALTHLIQPGSRVTYRLLLAGAIDQIRLVQNQLQNQKLQLREKKH